jgi:hypothetical protein
MTLGTPNTADNLQQENYVNLSEIEKALSETQEQRIIADARLEESTILAGKKLSELRMPAKLEKPEDLISGAIVHTENEKFDEALSLLAQINDSAYQKEVSLQTTRIRLRAKELNLFGKKIIEYNKQGNVSKAFETAKEAAQLYPIHSLPTWSFLKINIETAAENGDFTARETVEKEARKGTTARITFLGKTLLFARTTYLPLNAPQKVQQMIQSYMRIVGETEQCDQIDLNAVSHFAKRVTEEYPQNNQLKQSLETLLKTVTSKYAVEINDSDVKSVAEDEDEVTQTMPKNNAAQNKNNWEPPTLEDLIKNSKTEPLKGRTAVPSPFKMASQEGTSKKSGFPQSSIDFSSYVTDEGKNKADFDPNIKVGPSSRAPIPDTLTSYITKIEGDPGKVERLFDLWEVAQDKVRFKDVALTKQVKDIMLQAKVYAENEITQDMVTERLEKAIDISQDHPIEAIPEEELDQKNIASLETWIAQLLEKNPELKTQFGHIFTILKTNTGKYGENAEYLGRLKIDIEDLLLEDIAEKIGIGICDSYGEFMEKMQKFGLMESKKKLRSLEDLLLKNEELNELIEDFYRMTGRKQNQASPKQQATEPQTNQKTTEPNAGEKKAGETKDSTDSTSTGASTNTDNNTDASNKNDTSGSADGGKDNNENEKGEENAPGADWDSVPFDDENPDNQNKATDSSSDSDEVNKTEVDTAASVENAGHSIDDLLEHMGFDPNEKNPAIIAIKNVLSKWVGAVEFDSLEHFLKHSEVGNIVDQLAQKELSELQKLQSEARGEVFKIDEKIRALRKQYQLLSSRRNANVESKEEEANALLDQIQELTTRREDLNENYQNYRLAISRKKQGQTKETIHYSNPEQLLGMINLYFATQEANTKGETPNHTRVLQETQEQLEEARKSGIPSAIGRHVANFLTLGVLKPNLGNTLRAIAEKDPSLKRIKPEQMNELAKQSKDQGGVEAWIKGLEGSMKDKIEQVVPAIVGHLEVAINMGRISGLNSASLHKTKRLVMRLRRAIHNYSLSEAEKRSGNGIQKMNSYFASLNAANSNASKVSRKIIVRNAQKITARNGLIVGGLTAGATTLAGLSGLAMATAGIGIGTATGGISSLRIKDPATRKAVQRGAVRGLATAGILGGGLALGMTALPAAALALPAVFSPEIFKNRTAIKQRATQYGVPVVKGGARLGWATAGISTSLLLLGLPLLNPRYRRFFGMSAA